MKRNDIGRTTRYQLEVSTGWMEKNPESFVVSIDNFMTVAIQHDLFHIEMDISRVGFLTFTATPAAKTGLDAMYEAERRMGA